MSTSVLGVALFTSLFAATSVRAADAISAVTVVEGTGYTNVTVSATLTNPDGSEVLTFSVVKPNGTLLGSVDGAAGVTSKVVDIGSMEGFQKGLTYTYQVSVKGAEPAVSASTRYMNVGWCTNMFFKADATVSPLVETNGTWQGTAPSVEDSAYQIAGTEVVFKLNDAERGTGHDIIDFTCDANIDNCYLLDDITNDVTAAIGAISLVTNDEVSAAAQWMVLTNGSKWVAATGADPVTNKYNVRMEVDYSASPVQIRYSIKTAGASAWSTLKVAGSEWIVVGNAATVSNVCFSGKAAIDKFGATLSTTALVEVDGTGYDTLKAALDAAGSDKRVVLFTNLSIPPTGLTSGTYLINKNGKEITPINIPGKAPATSGGTVEVGDGELTTLAVTSGDFVAELSDGVFAKDGNLRFMTLNDATAAATNNVTIFMIKDAASSAVIGESATLDLRGWTLTQGDAKKPVVTVSGSTKKVTVVGGGLITGAAIAALAATNGAVVVINDIAITNNTGKAVFASEGSTVVISNGWFQSNGALATVAAGAVKIDGGYFVDAGTFGDTGVKAAGGKYTSSVNPTDYLADGYKVTNIGVPISTNDLSFVKEVTKAYVDPSSPSEPIPTTVWPISEDKSTVEIADAFVATLTGLSPTSTPAETQAVVTAGAAYGGGKMKNWECYVLGVSPTTPSEGPYVKSVQTAEPGQIGFKFATADMVRAAASGAKVEYQVEAYDGPNGNKVDNEGSARVNYTETATAPNPSAVRYYKLKVFITPKK